MQSNLREFKSMFSAKKHNKNFWVLPSYPPIIYQKLLDSFNYIIFACYQGKSIQKPAWKLRGKKIVYVRGLTEV